MKGTDTTEISTLSRRNALPSWTYRTPAYRAEARAIHADGPPSGEFRGFGVPQAAILQETLYDDLAGAAGLDRLAFRRLNALSDGDATPTGQVLELHRRA